MCNQTNKGRVSVFALSACNCFGRNRRQINNTIFLLVYGLLMVNSSFCWATDYYVKNGGNNSLSGLSDTTAWATFTNVNSRIFYPGDRILLKRGSTFTTSMVLHGSGNASYTNYVTSYGTGALPKIRLASESAGVCIYGSDVQYWTISGIDFDRALRGVEFTASLDSSISNITVQNCNFTNMNYVASWTYNQHGCAIAFPASYTRSPYNWSEMDHFTVDNCTFTNCCVGIFAGMNGDNNDTFLLDMAYNYMMDHLTITNCDYTGGYWTALRMFGNIRNLYVSNVDIHDMGFNFVGVGSTGVILGGCYNAYLEKLAVWNVTNGRQLNSQDGVGFDFEGGNTNCYLTDSLIFNNDGGGIEWCCAWRGDYGDTIQNCQIYNNCLYPQGPGIQNWQLYAWGLAPLNPVSFINCGFYKNSTTWDNFPPFGNFHYFDYTNNPYVSGAYQPGWTPVYQYQTGISCGNANYVWATNSTYNTIHRLDNWNELYTGNCWTPITGSMKQVDVGSDGTAWATNNNNNVYAWNGSYWVSKTGTINKVSVGSASNIWGIYGTNVYQWNGSSWATRNTGLSDGLDCIAASRSDGTAWGRKGNYVYRWNGSNWGAVASGLTNITCKSWDSAAGIYSNTIYYTNNGGVSWATLPGSFTSVSWGSDGSMWAIASDQTVWRYTWGYPY